MNKDNDEPSYIDLTKIRQTNLTRNQLRCNELVKKLKKLMYETERLRQRERGDGPK